ncbi:S8 family peptidase [Neobacillus sp. C211]|uniref:S8 family peptidase n=1 Tax=unclassified Neobacillus TaxID=2675272 RepID=UPI00397BC0A6
MSKKNDDVRLIPFTVNAVMEKTSKIPQGVEMVGAPKMWLEDYQGKGIVVAILDTGCQKDHPDLKNRIVGGRNFTLDYNRDPNNFNDNNGHGTHVAGTIAADGTGGGVLGVAPQAQLLICKVLDSKGSGSYDSIIQGIYFAIGWRGANGERVRVINMSLGGSEGTDLLHKAIVDAVEAGISVICAAGNEGDSSEDSFEYAYPGAYNEVTEIGAVDFDGKLAYFSNNNTEIDCVGPGVDILSTWPGSNYATISGTSMATPHIAGCMALVIQRAEKEFARSINEAEAYAQLIKETIPLGFRKSSEGNGLVKLQHAASLQKLILYVKENFA